MSNRKLPIDPISEHELFVLNNSSGNKNVHQIHDHISYLKNIFIMGAGAYQSLFDSRWSLFFTSLFLSVLSRPLVFIVTWPSPLNCEKNVHAN